MKTPRQADAERMARECLSWAEEHEEEAEHRMNVSAFEDMLKKVGAGRELSEKQILWIRGVHEKLFEAPQYENLVSRGLVPRGREVATPAVLQNLPKKPPPRKVVDE